MEVAPAHDEKQQNLGKVYAFFCWCSGARLYILRKCPTDYNKYFGIGSIVFFTGLMAALSGGYAIHTVFNSLAASVAFGIFWGILIFLLDWYIVSSLKKNNNLKKELMAASPRLLLSVLLAIVISKPLELKLFEQEINQELAVIQNDKIANFTGMVDQSYDEINELQKENIQLQNDIKEMRNKREELFSMIIAEAEGRSATGKAGKGPVYKEKQSEFKRMDEAFTLLQTRNLEKIEKNDEKINILKQNKQNEVKEGKAASQGYNGFLARIEALGAMANRNTTINLVNWFIIVLFILIESSPILVKLMSSRGAYDEYFDAEELHLISKATKKIISFKYPIMEEEELQQKIDARKREKKLNNDLEFIDILFNKQQELNKIKVDKWDEAERRKLEGDDAENLKKMEAMLGKKITISEIS